MRDIDRAQRLLSLFTSAECAEAIAGDLAEERRDRGAVWFWRHVLGTVVALSRRAVAAAPLRTLALLAAGCAQFGTPAFAGVAVVSLFPPLFNSPIGWMVLSLSWWGGALWTGAFLVTIAPTRGMAMCVVLALLGEVLTDRRRRDRGMAAHVERRIRSLLRDSAARAGAAPGGRRHRALARAHARRPRSGAARMIDAFVSSLGR